jgi:indolepyruvate ferredoxin oxidoreductase alpha subunit
MLELRIRACHVYGEFTAKANRTPSPTLAEALAQPIQDTTRITLPPVAFQHEQEKVASRWPDAVSYIREHHLNEVFQGAGGDVGLVLQGGLYNSVIRALQLLGLADAEGATPMNVTYPLVDDELVAFCADKRAVLMVEEGQPDFLEQALHSILRKAGVATRVEGKGLLPAAGEYTPFALEEGVAGFLVAHGGPDLQPGPAGSKRLDPVAAEAGARLQGVVPERPAGFCTGCPERPLFGAIKLLQQELGEFHVSCDIGCHLFSILPPFHVGNTTMGYGLGAAGSAAFNVPSGRRKVLSVMGDGGFWHNGLTSGIGNAVFNKSDNVIIIIDNGYSSATGGQDLLSSAAHNPARSTGNPIENAVRGVGVSWVRTVPWTYDVGQVRDVLRDALASEEHGPKVVIAQSECMLNKQRREKPRIRARVREGKRAVRQRFGVDADVCTGDRACMRLSGCPSLTLAPVARAAGDAGRRQLRRLRLLRRGGPRGRALPVVLPRRRRAQPVAFRTCSRPAAPARDRLARDPGGHRGAADVSGARISVAITAMGGQGGGVLSDWILQVAEGAGWTVQTTSVPGVAQRTGATIYSVELCPPRDGGPRPVLGLMPVPGDVDICLAAELMGARSSAAW